MDKKITVAHDLEVPTSLEDIIISENTEKQEPAIASVITNTSELIEEIYLSMEDIINEFFIQMSAEIEAVTMHPDDLDPDDLANFKALLVEEVLNLHEQFLKAGVTWEKQEDSILVKSLIEDKFYESISRINSLMDILKIAVKIKAKSQRAIKRVSQAIETAEVFKASIEKRDPQQRSPEEDKKLAQYKSTLKDRGKKKKKREKKHKVLVNQLDAVLKDSDDLDVIWASAEGLIDYLEKEYAQTDVEIDRKKLLAIKDLKESFQIVMSITRAQDPEDEDISPHLKGAKGPITVKDLKRRNKWLLIKLLSQALIYGAGIWFLTSTSPQCGEDNYKSKPAAKRKLGADDLKYRTDKDHKAVLKSVKFNFPNDIEDSKAMRTISDDLIARFKKLESRPRTLFSKKQLSGQVSVLNLAIHYKGMVIRPRLFIKDYKVEYASKTPIIKTKKMPDGSTQTVYRYTRKRDYVLHVMFPEFSIKLVEGITLIDKLGFTEPLKEFK